MTDVHSLAILCNHYIGKLLVVNLLIRGTASEVLGIDSETALRKTVRDSKTVTSKVTNINLHLLTYY